MKDKRGGWIGVIGLMLFGVIIGLFVSFAVGGDQDGICSPGIACFGDSLIYQTISCGLLVNTGDKNGVCDEGELNENHPLVSTSIGGEGKAVIIDTQLLDLEEERSEWKYYPKERIPAEFSEFRERVLLSPLGELVCFE